MSKYRWTEAKQGFIQRWIGALLSLTLIVLLAGCAEEKPPRAVPFDHAHALLDQVLRKHVEYGLVDYRALQAGPEVLNRYLQTLADADPEDYAGWTRQQKLAFWINAYNAYSLRAIIERYPITRSWLADPFRDYPANGIRQIFGVWNWLRWPALGKTYTLDRMEHVIMRKELVEPRIHFVIVCASIGCPLLESRAFDAANLEQRLDQAAVNYIYRDHKVQIDKKNNTVRLPQILNWFAEDFIPLGESAAYFKKYPEKQAGPLSWVYHYANKPDRKFLEGGGFQVTYLEYDWGLNERR